MKAQSTHERPVQTSAMGLSYDGDLPFITRFGTLLGCLSVFFIFIFFIFSSFYFGLLIIDEASAIPGYSRRETPGPPTLIIKK